MFGKEGAIPPIDQKALKSVAVGATLLASGGGGTFACVRKMIENFVKGTYYPSGTAEVVSLDEAIRSNDYAAVIAYIGAPEAIGAMSYPDAAVRAAECIRDSLERQGKRLSYIIPVEIGAVSSLVPCLVAAKLGLKVIDADGAKRAVPELTMLTFAAADVSTNPTVLANADGFSVTLDLAHTEGGDHWWQKQDYMAQAIEKLARPVIGLDAFQEIAGLGIWVMSSSELKQAVPLTGTLSTARAAGDLILNDNPSAESLVARLKAAPFNLKAYLMFEGQFQKDGVSVQTGGGFDVGRVRLKGTVANQEASILYQNESLIAWNSRREIPIAMAPDSIAYYVDNDQKVYSNGDIVQGNEINPAVLDKTVHLIGIAADPVLREIETRRTALRQQKDADRSSLLKTFQSLLAELGYLGPYIPIERIWG